MKKIIMSVVALAVISMTIGFVACKKEKETEPSYTNQKLEFASYPNPSTTHVSVRPAAHRTPPCISAMATDPEFELFDFGNIMHYHQFDTTGFYVYYIPSHLMPTDILCVGVTASDNEMKVRMVLSLPHDFDYQTYYNNGYLAYVEAYTYDYENIFFTGYLDVQNNSFKFSYVNPYLYEDDLSKLPPLWHWNEMNTCEKILTGSKLFWGVGFSIAGGPIGVVAGAVNGLVYDYIGEKVCR